MTCKLSDTDTLYHIKEPLQDAFKKLRLPEPISGNNQNQYMMGHGHLGLIFIHHAGCVLRLAQNHIYPLYRHRHLMRPIGSIPLSKNIRLDIQHTGICPVSDLDAHEAYTSLEASDLKIMDAVANNFCYIHTQDTKFPSGIPVIFDPLDVIPLTTRAQNLKKVLSGAPGIPRIFTAQNRIVDFTPQADETPDEQDVLFEDLRTKFKAMFNEATCTETTLSTKPRKVQAFWASMIEATKEGRLTPSWMSQKRGSAAALRRVDEISWEYAFALSTHNPLFADCTR